MRYLFFFALSCSAVIAAGIAGVAADDGRAAHRRRPVLASPDAGAPDAAGCASPSSCIGEPC